MAGVRCERLYRFAHNKLACHFSIWRVTGAKKGVLSAEGFFQLRSLDETIMTMTISAWNFQERAPSFVHIRGFVVTCPQPSKFSSFRSLIYKFNLSKYFKKNIKYKK